MKERMKRRLVGAAVLSALAVIFLPELLDNSKYYTANITIPPIPAQSLVAEAAFTQELLPEADNQALLPSTTTTTTDKVPITEESNNSSDQAQNQVAVDNTAWIVHVASFIYETNAKKLQDKLRKQGFTAFLTDGETNGKAVKVVNVGPELDRTRAENIADKIKKTFKFHTTVKSYP